MLQLTAIAGFIAITNTAPALAHTGEGVAGGFVSGLQHPVFGLDHLVAMVAVGLWGAFLGAPAIWVLPLAFPLVMAAGAALGIVGLPLPAVEMGIAASALVLGLMVAMAAKPPLWVAAGIVGLFAVFHGHAHGMELPESANPFAYAAGFVISTGLLHAAGIAFGLLTGSQLGRIAVRGMGAAIAILGVAFLSGMA
jgi:urease accessory protein